MSLKLFRWQKEVFLDRREKFIMVPAGRRSGKTNGAAKCNILWAGQGLKCLWVDTIYSNIDRYVERYFLPDLKATGLDYTWNVQKKILKIESGYIDFRSADRPESIEGFGYHKITLNEAGIILNDDYLYTNAILPMLIDFADSQLYAVGTPKGKINKQGEEHRFWKLCEKAKTSENHYSRKLSSHANPLLTKDALDELIKEMRDINEEAVLQEIYAEFVEASTDKVINSLEVARFKLSDIEDNDHVEGRFGAIDPADEGLDSYSFPLGDIIGTKIYIKDWLFTKENTNYTIPKSGEMIRENNLDYCVVETNNHGAIVCKNIRDEANETTILELYNTTKKHSRIISNAGFIKNYFVFRDDYEEGSDYDKAMKQVFLYTKDGKYKKDDAIDSLALFAAVVRDMYRHIWS